MTDDLLAPYRPGTPPTEEEAIFLARQSSIPGGEQYRAVVERLLRLPPAKGRDARAHAVWEALNRWVVELQRAGRYRDALGAAGIGLRVSLRLFGREHRDMLTSHNNLGLCLQTAGRASEALPHLEATYEMRNRVLGPEDEDTLASCHNLGSCLQLLGRAAEALRYFEMACEGRSGALGPEHPDTLNSRCQRGGCLRHLGRLEQALRELDMIYWICRRTTGENRRIALSIRTGRAACLFHLGRMREALRELEGVLEIRRRRLGEEHPDTLVSRNDWAACLLELGRAAEALPHLEQVCELRRRLLGDRHPDILKSHNTLGLCLKVLGRVEEGLLYFEEAYKASRRLQGPEHPTTLTSRANLAAGLLELGQTTEALSHMQAVLKVRRRTLGEEHPTTLGSRNDLGLCLLALGRAAEALPYLEAICQVCPRVLGDRHPYTLANHNNLGLCLLALGRAAEALSHLEDTHAARRQVLGTEHQDTLTSCNNLGLCLEDLGRLAEALGFLRDAYHGRLRVLGDDHPHTLQSRNNLAACLQRLGRLREALPHFETVYLGRRRRFGPNHPDTLGSRNNLAACLQRLGRTTEALPHYEAVFRASRETLGEAHPATLASRNNLAIASQALSERQAADQWRHLAKALPDLPQPGGRWMQILSATARALAEHARAGRIADWPTLFEGMAASLDEVTDLVDPAQWLASRERVAAFHATYLGLCLDLERPDLVPVALARLQGRKLAALVAEELDLRAAEARPGSLVQRFHAVKVSLRCLAFGRQVLPGDSSDAGGASCPTQTAIGLAQGRLQAYREKLGEYRLLRAQIEVHYPDLAEAAHPPPVALAELQAGLAADEALLLLLERRDRLARGQVVAVLVKGTEPTVVRDLGVWPSMPRAGTARPVSGGFRGLASGDVCVGGGGHQAPGPVDPGDEPLGPAPHENWYEWLQQWFWGPLSDDLAFVRTLHLVTQGRLHMLPYAVIAPQRIEFLVYPGLLYYQHLQRHRGAPMRPIGALGMRVYGAEDTACPIPLVGAEARAVRRLWSGRPVRDLKLVDQINDKLSCLHVAGHGMFDEHDPTQAKVWLGRGETLGFHNLLGGLHVPPLVFLSACVVGRVHEDPLEGEPLGLVGLLLLRGAHYCIAALQPVSDLYMPLLVTLFYQGWQRDQPPARALAEAKRRLWQGDWYEDTAALLREAYPPVMDTWIQRVIGSGRDPELLSLVGTWFPELLRVSTRQRLASIGGDLLQAARYVPQEDPAVRKELKALRIQLDSAIGRQRAIQGFLEDIELHRGNLPVDEIVGSVQGFGRGG